MFFIVATPIGNVEDISLRAVKTLILSDIILAEDTRSFLPFYKRIQELFGIQTTKKQKIIAFHDQNEFERIPYVLDELKRGFNIVLVSESGMPIISDPGQALVSKLLKENLRYTVVPGPSAFINAVVLSGLSTRNLLFQGFLPKKTSQVLRLFNKWKQIADTLEQVTVVFYESPYRIKKTLQLIGEELPRANIFVCREMTKKFEEVVSLKDAGKRNLKGELTVVLSLYNSNTRLVESS